MDTSILQVLAVLTALVDVYEAAALASLAAAQELVSTLRSAINAIDETITGTTGRGRTDR